MVNIPAIVGLGNRLAEEYDGKFAAIDGYEGAVYIDPDPETLCRLRESAEAESIKAQRLTQLKGKENQTLDSHRIDLFANIGGVGDVALALQNDAGVNRAFPH